MTRTTIQAHTAVRGLLQSFDMAYDRQTARRSGESLNFTSSPPTTAREPRLERIRVSRCRPTIKKKQGLCSGRMRTGRRKFPVQTSSLLARAVLLQRLAPRTGATLLITPKPAYVASIFFSGLAQRDRPQVLRALPPRFWRLPWLSVVSIGKVFFLFKALQVYLLRGLILVVCCLTFWGPDENI